MKARLEGGKAVRYKSAKRINKRQQNNSKRFTG